jgi:hypothetical protein
VHLSNHYFSNGEDWHEMWFNGTQDYDLSVVIEHNQFSALLFENISVDMETSQK